MLKELIKERFELSCRKRWFKSIDKELYKYNDLSLKLERQKYIVRAMIDRYNEIYGENLRLEERI